MKQCSISVVLFFFHFPIGYVYEIAGLVIILYTVLITLFYTCVFQLFYSYTGVCTSSKHRYLRPV